MTLTRKQGELIVWVSEGPTLSERVRRNDIVRLTDEQLASIIDKILDGQRADYTIQYETKH